MVTENVPYRWSRANFPLGSVGEQLVPEFIEGRDRPQATVNLPLSRLAGGEYLRRLETLNVTGLEGLLSISRADFTAALGHQAYITSIDFYICNYLRKVAVGSEGLLIYSIFGRNPGDGEMMPISPQTERFRVEAVRRVLKDLKPECQRVIDLVYGMTTGIAKTTQEIKQEKLAGNLQEAKRYLSYPSRLSLLRPFHALGENAVGRVVFGVTCGYEFQHKLEDSDIMELTLSDLVVSREFQQKIRQQIITCQVSNRFVYDLLQQPATSFSENMLEELQQEFQGFLKP
ncbi:hypothetical protein HY407_04120 [Candidatus Gottesmanbacteria bacterium]|nr:hypothetical protein [Candidatus Gottesmanbacteria bacterium]